MQSPTTEEWDRIVDGGSFRWHVNSIGEALDLAGKLQNRGYLFRGQTNAEWSVTSSAERLNSAQRDEAEQRIGRFIAWAEQTPELQNLLSDPDSLFAIAQHYGLPTMYIDFTSDPDVAAFFACDAKGQVSDTQRAVIICVNARDFEEFWTETGPLLLKGIPNAKLPQIIHINVHNLWRLQSQHGCFLWNPIANIEMHYDFDRITFPFIRDHPALPHRERIYPKNQSALEQLLTGFFMDERMREGTILVQSLKGMEQLEIVAEPDEYDMASWYSPKVKPTDDWRDKERWRVVSVEQAEDALGALAIHLRHSTDLHVAAAEVLDKLSVEVISRNRDRGIFFSDSLGGGSSSVLLRLQACIRRLWNGMRILPFYDSEIRRSLEMTVQYFLSIKRIPSGASHEFDPELFGDDRLYVEFSKNATGKGDYSRGYVTGTTFEVAHNAEFIKIAKEYVWKHFNKTSLTPSLLVQLRARPWQRFSFAGLRKLMVEELIPSQVVLRGDNPTDAALSVVIYFSPADIKIFGLA